MSWKKLITSASNASLNSLTTTGNISASGNIFANLPLDTSTNGLLVVQDPNTGKLFRTESIGGGGGGGDVSFNVGGTTGTLTNLSIQDFATDVATSIENGTLTITFGTPTLHTVLSPTVTGFSTNRFNSQEDEYTVAWNNRINLQGNTFISGELQRAATNSNTFTTVHTFQENDNSVNINSSFTSEDGTNLRIGSHKFRLKVTATLANGEDLAVSGSSTSKSINKTNPTFNASISRTISVSPSQAAVFNRIEDGATGTVSYTINPSNNNNGWTSLGFNTNEDAPTGADPNLTIADKTVTVTNTNLSSGDHYQWWNDGGLNNPGLQVSDEFSSFCGRMRSFRFGASPNASFTAAEFRDLDNWTTNVGTIRFGINTKNEINDIGTFVVTPDSSIGEYVYIVYDKNVNDLLTINTSTGVNQTGAFAKTTVGNYKVYRTNLVQFLQISLVVTVS